jgi:NADH dehydrogenase
MTEATKRICILGGGFAGLYTALRLSELPWNNGGKPEIVLVDKNDRFVFSPLLYELVTGEMQSWEVAPPFAEILADTGVIFRQALVENIDIPNRQVQLDNPPHLSFDRLVIALGGTTPVDLVPGVKEYAIPFRTLGDVFRLRQQLEILEQSDRDKIRVAVVGAGYSGVELACKLADRLGNRGRVRLIERGEEILGKGGSEFNRRVAQKTLEDKGIWTDLGTEVSSITADTISLLYKGGVDIIPVDLVLWTVGNKMSELVKGLPLAKNSQGMLVANPMLQVKEQKDIFALGDLAECRDVAGQILPATAQVAFQQSDYCAWNVWASLTDRPMLPFRYQPLGEMLSLGQDTAAIAGLGLKIDGTLGYLLRRLLYLYRLPTLKHQVTVGLSWITNPLLELIKS